MNTSLANISGGNLTNSTLDDHIDEDVRRFERVLPVVIPVIYGMIAVCGFIGNLLVIIVVLSNKPMRNSTNLLIINLAVADLLFIIICVPSTAVSFAMHWWPLGEFFCKMYQYSVHVTAYASVYTLVFMSLDRYLAVVHPISSMTIRTERNTAIVIICSWIVICTVNIPVALAHEVHEYRLFGENRSACYPDLAHPNQQVFYGSFFLFAYSLPLALVCVLYGFMLKRLLYGVVPGCQQSAESMRSKRRVSRMVIIVVLIFALSWLPLQIIFMYRSFGEPPDSVAFMAVLMASQCLMYTNSCVNPFLYAFLSENFRKSFMRLLCCGDRFNQPIKMELEKTTARGACAEAVTTRTYTTNQHNNGSTTNEQCV
jgi:allatostatin receptor